MPGIYERDNINYGGMLGNAMAAKANYLKNRYDRVADIGRTWGNAVSNSGQAIQNVLNQYAQQQYQAEQNALNREDVLKRAREQQAWQTKENELNRNNMLKLQQVSKEQAKESKYDDYMFEYNRNEAKIRMLQDALNKNPNDRELKFNLEDAKFNRARLRKRLGMEYSEPLQEVPKAKEPVPAVNESASESVSDSKGTGMTTMQLDANARKYMKTNDWTNSNKAMAMEYLSQIRDPAVKETLMNDINLMGETKEQRQAQINAAINAAIESGDRDKLPDGYMVRTFGDDNVQYVATKKGGNWIKVKKWGK